VAAAPGDEAFYAVYESGNNDGGIRIYRFQLDASGSPSALIEVAGGLITGQDHLLNVGGFAVSPDGSQLAVAAAADPASGDPQEIVVVNLRSGAQSIWHGGLARTGSAFGITDLSWTGDGRSLVYLAQWCQTQHSGEAMIGLTCNANSTDAQVRELNVASGGGRLDSGPVLLQPSQARQYIGQALINPAGNEIAAVVQAAPGAALEVAEISVATGKTVSVLYRMADPGPADFEVPHLATDSSGQYLLFGTGGSGSHHGWIKDGTLRKLPPSTDPGDWEGFAW
jgi:WD40 repeat protein